LRARVQRACVFVPHGCVGPPVARRGPAVFIAWPAMGRACMVAVVPSVGSGRRCDVGEPHDQRAMGCAIFPHVRGRRHLRRHLHHRRCRLRRLPAGRVGRQRWGPDSVRGTRGYLGGYLYSKVTKRYYTCTCEFGDVLTGYCRGTGGAFAGYSGHSQGTQFTKGVLRDFEGCLRVPRAFARGT
jgi:hypothetical protein